MELEPSQFDNSLNDILEINKEQCITPLEEQNILNCLVKSMAVLEYSENLTDMNDFMNKYKNISYSDLINKYIIACLEQEEFLDSLFLREIAFSYLEKIFSQKGLLFYKTECYTNVSKVIENCFQKYKISKEFLSEQILYQYEELKIDFAYSYMCLFKSLFFSENENFEENLQKIFDKIEFFWLRISGIQNDMDVSDNWTYLKNEKEIKLAYKQGDVGNEQSTAKLITTFIDAEISCSIYNLLVLIYELDLYKKFLPFCQESIEWQKIGRAGKLAYQKFNVKILKREVIMVGFGWDRLFHKGCVLIDAYSVQENEQTLKLQEVAHPVKYNCTSADVNISFIEIYPTGVNDIRIRMLCRVNPNLMFIPSMLLNFGFKQILGFLLNHLKKQTKDAPSGEWKDRMNDNKEFYDWMKNKVDRYLPLYNSNV